MIKELKNISNLYYSNNYSIGNYKYITNDDYNVVSCIKLETLIKQGLIADNTINITNNLPKIKVNLKKDSVIN